MEETISFLLSKFLSFIYLYSDMIILLADIYSFLYYRACGPKEEKEARDTLARPAEGNALCTPSSEWMSVYKSFSIVCFHLCSNRLINKKIPFFYVICSRRMG